MRTFLVPRCLSVKSFVTQRMTFVNARKSLWVVGRLFSNLRIRPYGAIVKLKSQQQGIFTGALNMETVDTTKRLAELRSLMRSNNVDIYGNYFHTYERSCAEQLIVVPSEDSHQSEYTAPCDQRRGLSSDVASPFVAKSHNRVYQWLLWFCWYSYHYKRARRTSNRRSLFQSGREAARQ